MSSEDPPPSRTVPAGVINRPGFSFSGAPSRQRGAGAVPAAGFGGTISGAGGAKLPSGCIRR